MRPDVSPITSSRREMIKVNVAKIINDTMTRKKKVSIHKTHASICQRSKATHGFIFCLVILSYSIMYRVWEICYFLLLRLIIKKIFVWRFSSSLKILLLYPKNSLYAYMSVFCISSELTFIKTLKTGYLKWCTDNHFIKTLRHLYQIKQL